jgi:hypothetical protein
MMKVVGRLVAVVAIGMMGFFVVAPNASAAPCPVSNGQSTGPGSSLVHH